MADLCTISLSKSIFAETFKETAYRSYDKIADAVLPVFSILGIPSLTKNVSFPPEWPGAPPHGRPGRPRGRGPKAALSPRPRRRGDRGLPDRAARGRPLRARAGREAPAGQGSRREREGPQRIHPPAHRLQEEQDQGRGAAPQARSQ